MMDDMAKQQAQKDYQQELNRLAREAATRSLLLDVYSPNQLQQQLSWFWLNHFSVHQGKHNLRAMVGDYEMNAIAPHALGKFRDLLAATVHHPAMLRYLDNEANAANRINENYARELMELHTLGVNGGYSQKDVQELARILTGVGVNLGADTPKVKPALQAQYVRRGLFEFNPNRHDYGDKQFLGQTVKGTRPGRARRSAGQTLPQPGHGALYQRQAGPVFCRRHAARNAGGRHGANLPARPTAISPRCCRPCLPARLSSSRWGASSRTRCTMWCRPCACRMTTSRS